MAASPLLLGTTTHNYLGRSQNPTHPYLTGAVAGFRLHNRALAPADVAALAAPDTAGASATARPSACTRPHLTEYRHA